MPGPILGYHGCDATTAEAVLTGRSFLAPSDNDYDWLGPGIYFWVDSPERAMDWAREQGARGRIANPAVVGALLHPGNCLNLTDFGVLDDLRKAHTLLQGAATAAGATVPANSLSRHGVTLMRRLDCAVIRMVHELHESIGAPAYDSAFGVFEEGAALFPGSGFKEKTHIQIAIRNAECVAGYFRVPGL